MREGRALTEAILDLMDIAPDDSRAVRLNARYHNWCDVPGNVDDPADPKFKAGWDLCNEVELLIDTIKGDSTMKEQRMIHTAGPMVGYEVNYDDEILSADRRAQLYTDKECPPRMMTEEEVAELVSEEHARRVFHGEEDTMTDQKRAVPVDGVLTEVHECTMCSTCDNHGTVDIRDDGTTYIECTLLGKSMSLVEAVQCCPYICDESGTVASMPQDVRDDMEGLTEDYVPNPVQEDSTMKCTVAMDDMSVNKDREIEFSVGALSHVGRCPDCQEFMKRLKEAEDMDVPSIVAPVMERIRKEEAMNDRSKATKAGEVVGTGLVYTGIAAAATGRGIRKGSKATHKFMKDTGIPATKEAAIATRRTMGDFFRGIKSEIKDYKDSK